MKPKQFSTSEVTTLWRYTNVFIIIISIIIINNQTPTSGKRDLLDSGW